jgi:hypothetical protein
MFATQREASLSNLLVALANTKKLQMTTAELCPMFLLGLEAATIL